MLSRLWNVLSFAAEGWVRHKATRLGAALAYYSVFSLGPLLLIVVATAGVLFGDEDVSSSLTSQLRSMLGPVGSQAIEAMLKGAASKSSGIFAALTGAVLLFVAAVGVVVQLKDALNTVWEVEQRKRDSGWWNLVRGYLVSFAGILVLGVMLAASLVVSTVLSATSGWFGGGQTLIWQGINFAISLAVLAALFAMLFKWFPDANVRWRDAILGGTATALLFNFGKQLISWYIGTQGLASTYGAAASIVVLLVWVYYSAQIVLFGAEVTHAAGTPMGAEPA